MAKSILVFYKLRPIIVCSNKTNAWLAIEDYVKRDGGLMEDLLMVGLRDDFLVASYGMVANRLSKFGKCELFAKAEIDAAIKNIEQGLENDHPVAPLINVYQFETNVGNNGVLYKSTEKEELNFCGGTEKPVGEMVV